MESPADIRLAGSGIPQLNAREVVEALGKWEGMEDTISLFSDLIKDNSMIPIHCKFHCSTICIAIGIMSIVLSTTSLGDSQKGSSEPI